MQILLVNLSLSLKQLVLLFAVFFRAGVIAPFLDGETLLSMFEDVSATAVCGALMFGTPAVSQFIGTSEVVP